MTYTGYENQTLYAGRSGRHADITTLTLQPSRNDTCVPLTFGQPFSPDAWNPKSQELALFIAGERIPAQANGIALHGDGSARYAVVSAVVPDTAAGVDQTVQIKAVPRKVGISTTATLPADWDVKAEMLEHRCQITRITLTDRKTGGYVLGETITIKLSGIGETETYTHTIVKGQTGASHELVRSISYAIQEGLKNSAAYEVNTAYETLFVRAKDRVAGAFAVEVTYSGSAKLTVENDYEFAPQILWRADFREQALVKLALANAGAVDAGVRFHGPAATELILAVPATCEGVEHPTLTCRAHVRIYHNASGPRVRTSVCFERCKTFSAATQQMTYSAKIFNGNALLEAVPAFDHRYAARWRRVIWHNEASPEMHFRHDKEYFVGISKAVLNYDTSIEMSEAEIGRDRARLEQAKTKQALLGPMGYCLWTPDMPGTGGRPDIGPSPKWYVTHILAQTPDTLATMVEQADAAAATWSAHYRDETTGLPVSIKDWPSISVVQTYGSTPGIAHQGPKKGLYDLTTSSPDNAHQPDIAYIPYLVTGDYYYHEELQFWASWCVASRPADYRDFDKGWLFSQNVRAIGWSLRNVSNAARILPEDDKLKPLFVDVAAYNFSKALGIYNEKNVASGEVCPLGALMHSESSTAPWQNEFLLTTFALNAQNGNEDAQKLAEWVSRFVTGRVGTEGLPLPIASCYYVYLREDINGRAGNWYTNWQQVQARVFPDSVGVPVENLVTTGYPGSPVSFNAYLLGACAAVYNIGVESGKVGYDRYKPYVPGTALYNLDPTWSIVPKFAN